MGWFRLFDRLRLRPASEAPEGWALPGSALRLTDPHLASYFRGLIDAAGVSARADLFDITSHAFARSVAAAPEAGLHRFHVDIRAMGAPSGLLFGSDNRHAMLSWHAASRMAALCLPGQEMVELREVELLSLMRANLPISDIATMSAWLARAEAIPGILAALGPWFTDQTVAMIRLPGATLPHLMTMLPSMTVQPVALLPCEPETDDPSNPLPDIVVCLAGLSSQPEAASSAETTRQITAPLWSAETEATQEGGLSVTPLAESRSVGYGLPVTLIGDAPPTPVGAALYGMQRSPARGEAAHGLRFELQAASLFAHEMGLIALPMMGPAVVDPDLDALTDATEFSLSRNGPIRDVEARATILLGSATSPADFAARIWPKLELAFDLIERDKLSPDEIALLLPDGADPWTLAAIELCGFGPSSVRAQWDGVLFRQLVLCSPACDLGALRRSDIFDRFWQRFARLGDTGRAASVTQPRNSGRVILLAKESRLLNALELAAVARNRMYQVIDPNISSAAELASALRAARVVVVEREAAIWSAFARGAALGLLQSDTDPEIPHAGLHAASACGHQVTAMFGSAIGDDAEASYFVAVDRFTLMLERLESPAQAAGDAA